MTTIMNMILLSAFFSSTIVALYTNDHVPMLNTTHIETIDEIDLTKYDGLWYQMYADKLVYKTIEQNTFCDTALYTLQTTDTISVHNYATIDSPKGEPSLIDGYAYVVDPTDPGKLKVHFDSDDAAPFDAPYWILNLGPVNTNDKYDWAIVSDNLSAFLFVLARDVYTFNTIYETEVLELLEQYGFIGKRKPIKTYQHDDCIYEESS